MKYDRPELCMLHKIPTLRRSQQESELKELKRLGVEP